MNSLEIVAIEIVEGCNLKCEFCARDAYNDKNEIEIESFSDFIDCAKKCEVKQIALTGGEPLLHSRIIDIVELLEKKRMYYSITTNGTILNEKMISRLKKAVYFKYFIVSVDSFDKDTNDSIRGVSGTFDRIEKFIGLLKNNDIGFLVNMTVNRKNINHIYNTVLWAKRIGARDISVSMAKPSGRGKADLSRNEIKLFADEMRKSISLVDEYFDVWATEVTIFLHHYDLYEEDYKSGNCYSCAFGDKSLHIAFNGDVKGCATCDFVLGNLYKGDELIDIWNNNEILNKIRNKEHLSGICGKCEYKDYCGGCRCRAYALTGDLFGDDLYCPLIGEK